MITNPVFKPVAQLSTGRSIRRLAGLLLCSVCLVGSPLHAEWTEWGGVPWGQGGFVLETGVSAVAACESWADFRNSILVQMETQHNFYGDLVGYSCISTHVGRSDPSGLPCCQDCARVGSQCPDPGRLCETPTAQAQRQTVLSCDAML